jgi:hypothetical protein
MPQRVGAFLLSLLLVRTASSQCTVSPVASVQLRSTIYALAVDGTTLWAATGYGLTLYDTTVDPPVIADTIALPGLTRMVRAANGVGYATDGKVIQVVRWDGHALQLTMSLDAGGTINDLALTPDFLYAATSKGIAQFDLHDPAAPARTSVTFPLSGAATAIAVAGDLLYATESDSSIEVFTPDGPFPVRGDVLAAVSQPTSLLAYNGRLYVSNDYSMDILEGSGKSFKRVAGSPLYLGAHLVAALSPTVIFVGGGNILRALDTNTSGAPEEVFRATIPQMPGASDVIQALAVGNGRLFVGAGDIGLITYDIEHFGPPYAVRSYAAYSTYSVAAGDGHAYFGRANGIVEYTQSPAGSLTELRSWDTNRWDTVQDVDNGFLLTTIGAEATMWDLAPAVPTAAGRVVFRAGVSSAVLVGTTAYAVLTDRTLWTVDMAEVTAAPRQIAINLLPSFIARSGSTVAITDVSSPDGKTTVAAVNADGVTASATVKGWGYASFALSGTTAAVWTDSQGLTLIDLSTGTTSTLPNSISPPAARLALNGTRLVAITASGVVVWDTALRRTVAQYPLYASAVAISPNGLFANLVGNGVTVVQLAPASSIPAPYVQLNGNFYARKVVAGAGRVVVFGGGAADIFDSRLAYRGGIRSIRPGLPIEAANIVMDVAANEYGIYTLTAKNAVRRYTGDGELLEEAIVVEPDAIFLALDEAGGALYVSVVRGCPQCRYETIVVDTRGKLAPTVIMSGTVGEVAVSGQRAYVLIGGDIRVLDISDPAYPRELTRRLAEGSPSAIVYNNGLIHAIGRQRFSYKQSFPLETPEKADVTIEDPYKSEPYLDQHAVAQDGCIVLTGRSFAPLLFNNSFAVPAPSLPTPSAARSIVAQPGRFYVLTDHSLELWATSPLDAPSKRRAAAP